MKDDLNFRCFVRCVSDLLTTEQVQKMRQWRHHFDVTCYDHSIFVSYVAFRLARRASCTIYICTTPTTKPPTRATSA
ncbi:MAG: hypothetical protein RR606_02425 [Oscillospiraceae bacterium]